MILDSLRFVQVQFLPLGARMKRSPRRGDWPSSRRSGDERRSPKDTHYGRRF